MVEMEIENERVDRLRLQQFGEEWIRAITDKAFDRLGQFCTQQITCRLLTPREVVTYDNVDALMAKYQTWFGGCTEFQVDNQRIAQVGAKLGIFYRFRLKRDGDWKTIEQQLYCTLKDSHVQELQLLCSGFQRVVLDDQAVPAEAPVAGQPDPIRDELLELYAADPQVGSTCAVLTPLIASKLREMNAGQVLEVRVDDLSARGDVEAWSRMSGNGLLKVVDTEGPLLRFFVQKK